MIRQGFYLKKAGRGNHGKAAVLPVHFLIERCLYEKNKIRQITSSDSLHTYGSIGVMDYTVRLNIRLDDVIEGEVLKAALESTQKRYPYLKLRMKKEGADLYYEENPLPVCLFNTDQKISLNCEQSNYHIWAVCYKDDFVYLDFYHGICDGTGMYMVLSTLLYYYIEGKYGNCDSTGIRTLEVPIGQSPHPFLLNGWGLQRR